MKHDDIIIYMYVSINRKKISARDWDALLNGYQQETSSGSINSININYHTVAKRGVLGGDAHTQMHF